MLTLTLKGTLLGCFCALKHHEQLELPLINPHVDMTVYDPPTSEFGPQAGDTSDAGPFHSTCPFFRAKKHF